MQSLIQDHADAFIHDVTRTSLAQNACVPVPRIRLDAAVALSVCMCVCALTYT